MEENGFLIETNYGNIDENLILILRRIYRLRDQWLWLRLLWPKLILKMSL
jgi:hypothetical protein